MLIYILIFTGIILTTFYAPRNNKIACLWIVLLCFLSMFRAETVGTDTSTYMDIFHMFKSYEYEDEFQLLGRGSEILISYLYFVIYNNSLSPRLIIAFMSVTTFVFLYLSLKRSKLPYSVGVLTFLILFFFSSLNISRQICACSITLYACTYLFENSRKKYLFFVFCLLASTIHSSSIICIVLYAIRYANFINVNKRTLVVIACMLFIANVVLPFNISEILISKFGTSMYAELYSDRAITSSRSFMGLMQDFLVFSSLIAVFIYNKEKKPSKPELIFYLTILFTLLSSNAHSDVSRIFLPITIFQVLYMAYIYKIKPSFIKSPHFLLFVSINTFFTLWKISTGAFEVIPYVLDLQF